MVQQNTDGWGNPASGGQDQELKRRREKLMALLRGRLHWAIILGVILGTCGGVAGWSLHHDRYQSTTPIEFQPTVELVTGPDQGTPPYFQAYMQQQLETITGNPAVVKAAMQEPIWKNHERAAGLPDVTESDFREAIQITEPHRLSYIGYVTFESDDPKNGSSGRDRVDAGFQAIL